MYRRWLFGETSRVINLQNAPVKVLTAYLEEHARGGLEAADPRRLKDGLRQRLNRAGISQSVAIGGIEASFTAGKWIVHAHMAVTGLDDTAIESLRRLCNRLSEKRSLVVQDLNDRAKQLSYLLKFHTYNRPTNSGRAYPLKPEVALELVHWQNGYSFEDFLFQKGLRRRGARLELV
jgi:hypothetical protein